MFDAFSIALSALNGNATAVNVIGNNLANLNTPGFKGSTVSFQDLVSQSMATTSSQVGSGTAQPISVRHFNQGTIQTTGNAMDAAIQGQGFFVVRDTSGRTMYTRAGNFHLDSKGNLVTITGERVQGWTALNGAVDPNAAVGNIVIPFGTVRPPKATTQMSVDLNLNAAADKDATFSTPVEVVDSLGGKHVLTVAFTKTDAGAWKYDIYIPGEEVKGGTAGKPFAIAGATGTLNFDDQGKLKTPAADAAPVSIKVAGLTNGAGDLNVNWSLYTADKVARLTQFSQPSALSATAQDGVPSGQITDVSIGDGGKIVAHYSNGQEEFLGQLALASIRNAESLVAMGNNNFETSLDSAAPAIGTADTGGRGKVTGGALEASTVDIAREFTDLIVMQRSYQANARVITASDELSQEIINIKR